MVLPSHLHFKAVKTLANNYNYIILIELPKIFLGYDKIQKQWTIVYFQKQVDSYVLDPYKEQEVFKSQGDAVKVFVHHLKGIINETSKKAHIKS